MKNKSSDLKFFDSLEMLKGRKLTEYTSKKPVHISELLHDYFDILKFKFNERNKVCHIILKVYEELPHGNYPKAFYKADKWTQKQNYLVKLKRVINDFDIEKSVLGYSGVFFENLSLENHVIKQEDLLQSIKDFSTAFFIPMLDLEILSTKNVRKDLDQLMTAMKKAGLSGHLIRSGDIGRGSYMYVGDFVMPHFKNYWQLWGLSMIHFVRQPANNEEKENIKKSLYYGNLLLKADTLKKAINVSESILKAFPSIPSSSERPGILYDPRYIAHRIIEPVSILRVSKAKGYKEPPVVVCSLL